MDNTASLGYSHASTNDETESDDVNAYVDEVGVSIDEVQKEFNMNENCIKWLNENHIDEENCVMVFNFVSPACYQNRAHIFALFEQNGAQKLADNMYKFQTWADVYKTKHIIIKQFPQCFYTTNAIIAHACKITQSPTITSTAITYFSKSSNKVLLNPYPFFEH